MVLERKSHILVLQDPIYLLNVRSGNIQELPVGLAQRKPKPLVFKSIYRSAVSEN